MSPITLVIIFIAASVVGYLIIKKIPSLLHTPLMSGMNALSGITVVGAIIALLTAIDTFVRFSFFGESAAANVPIILSGIAIILAMVNIVGGFGVTERMLRMFKIKDKKKGGSE